MQAPVLKPGRQGWAQRYDSSSSAHEFLAHPHASDILPSWARSSSAASGADQLLNAPTRGCTVQRSPILSARPGMEQPVPLVRPACTCLRLAQHSTLSTMRARAAGTINFLQLALGAVPADAPAGTSRQQHWLIILESCLVQWRRHS